MYVQSPSHPDDERIEAPYCAGRHDEYSRKSQASVSKRVLLIDDDPKFIGRLQAALEGSVELQVVTEAGQAVQAFTEWRPDLILLDVHIAPGDSFKVLDDISRAADGMQISLLCLSRGAGSATRLQSFGNMVFGILKREIDTDALLDAVHKALDNSDPVAA